VGNQWEIADTVGSGPLPDTIVSPVDGAEMVLVPKGPFTQGITQEELVRILSLAEQFHPAYATEMPARSVYLEDYYIDRYPVTNYQYVKFIEDTGHRKPMLSNDPAWNRPMQPVVFVGWDDARTYARWAGKCLPTESQWEKAGRGTDRRTWAWGNDFYPDRCNYKGYELGYTSEIGLFDTGVSPYGCYDMCGNVWEMCEGKWLEDRLPMRGGCFLGSELSVRVTRRWTPEDTVDGAHWLGFRCVKNIPASK
jgi:iron(II)-dependent oxidoreductase